MIPSNHCKRGLLLLWFGVTGCKNLERFDTHSNESYCGTLVGQQEISMGFGEPGWNGSVDHPTLALTLNTSDLFKAGGVPAVIDSNDAEFGPCGNGTPLFKQASVRTIDKAIGDRLGSMHLDEDHVEDVMTFVDSSCSGSMVGLLSLIQGGSVELRLLRPAPPIVDPESATSETTPRFGLFVLNKRSGGCGF
ncbi:MAG TPA: hypothetical protein VIV60_07530 [Polyangiaceae bacterium]